MLLQAAATVDLQNKVENCSSVTCVVPCTLFTGNMNVRKHSQLLTAADMHWRIKSFVLWKHVHLVHGLGTCFPNKFGQRMLVWDQNCSEFFSYETCTCVQRWSLVASFGVKQCSTGHTGRSTAYIPSNTEHRQLQLSTAFIWCW